jgi:hypothetical protein
MLPAPKERSEDEGRYLAGRRDVQVRSVPGPVIEQPTNAPDLRQAADPAHGTGNVRRWIDDLLPLVSDDDDPLGVDDYATHRMPLDEAPRTYELVQKKEDNAFKMLLQP